MNPRITITDLQRSLSDVLDEMASSEDCLIVTRHGRDVAALVPMAYLQRLADLDQADADPADPPEKKEGSGQDPPEYKTVEAPDYEDGGLMERIEALRMEIGLPPFDQTM